MSRWILSAIVDRAQQHPLQIQKHLVKPTCCMHQLPTSWTFHALQGTMEMLESGILVKRAHSLSAGCREGLDSICAQTSLVLSFPYMCFFVINNHDLDFFVCKFRLFMPNAALARKGLREGIVSGTPFCSRTKFVVHLQIPSLPRILQC